MSNKTIGSLFIIGLALIALSFLFSSRHVYCERNTIGGVIEIGDFCS